MFVTFILGLSPFQCILIAFQADLEISTRSNFLLLKYIQAFIKYLCILWWLGTLLFSKRWEK